MSVLVFCCKNANDLYGVLTSMGYEYPRFERPEEALGQLGPGGGALVLAGDYPERTTDIPLGTLEEALGAGGRVYVEYPAALPNTVVGEPRDVKWERGIISSDKFQPMLDHLGILDLHRCSFVPVEADSPHIELGRVAGLNTAIYGPPKERFPLLFEHSEPGLMVGTTKLSHFITGRYSPMKSWQSIWSFILDWLSGGRLHIDLEWTPTVRPAHGRTSALPVDAETQALQRGIEWFQESGLVASAPEGKAKPRSDGTGGLMEGFGSLINPDGSQPMNRGLRADCIGEGAGALSFSGVLGADHPGREIAANLIEFVFHNPPFAQGPRADPRSPSYGLVSWGASPPADSIYYGDDNARFMLGLIAVAANLECQRWNEGLLRCLLANLRTTGSRGFRGWRLEEKDLKERGWRHFSRRRNTFFAPHYEAYLWACFLWAYRETRYRPFLTKARKAIGLTMEGYPEKWRWTNGIAQERARMLLPLAWLVRVDDTRRHREWLEFMGKEVIARQDECGGLREELGGPGRGSYGPPRSNDDYGEHEATLMQANGDPICDMLYTTNFAFLGLHEAAAAMGGGPFGEAEDKLAEFLCRIQTRSDRHRELSGAWYRAFDMERWAYWGSNADAGWGVWSIESGWTQGWIVTVLGLKEMGTSLWDLSAGSHIGEHVERLVKVFFPEKG